MDVQAGLAHGICPEDNLYLMLWFGPNNSAYIIIYILLIRIKVNSLQNLS